MQILAGELARRAAKTPGYNVWWVGYARLTNIRLKTLGPPSSKLLLVYADLNSGTVAWPPEQTLEIEEDDRQTRNPFLLPQLTRHEPLTRLTLVSPNDFGGSGDSGGTFFGN